MANWETFKLTELKLDQKNYRTGPQSSQRAAILAIIDDQKDNGGLVNLARDILEMGTISPGEPIWVTREDGFYVVLEGNRRVAALKLMENPKLADGTIVEEDFAALAKQYKERPIRELEARTFTTRLEAQPWIRRRHLRQDSGVGLQRWKPMAQGRADREHGKAAPRFLIVFELLEDDSEGWTQIAQVLDTKWTTVDRVLNTKALRELLGVDIDLKSGTIRFENGDEKAGKKLLREILATMATPDFDFALIERVEDREDFLQRFLASSVKAKSAGGAGGKPSGGSTKGGSGAASSARASASAAGKASSKPKDQSERASLAPKSGSRTFQSHGVRLEAIYRECRNISVRGNENAAALLLRVFIELSSEAYLAERRVPLPADAVKKGRTKWDDFGISLASKVGCVADHLDPTGKAKEFQQARLALDATSRSPSSISTLHGYFHNRLLKPDAILAKEAWDAWESYLRQVHAAL